MTNYKEDLNGIRICLNHSQTLLEQSMLELDCLFQKWARRPFAWAVRHKLISELDDFRWMLGQHFRKVFGEDSLVRVADATHTVDSEYRDIANWQTSLLEQLDLIINSVKCFPRGDVQAISIAKRFEDLHREVVCEEREECSLVKRAFD
jgi:hypothetical protein